MDLYQILGVRRNSSAATIQKAFRKLVKKHHPDCGGDRAKFDEIHLAYSVLFDEKKREYYDRTGEIPKQLPDNELSQILSVISPCLMQCIDELIKLQALDSADLIQTLKNTIKAAQQQLMQNKQGYQNKKKTLESLLGKFITEETTNILEDVIRGNIAGLDSAVVQIDGNLAKGDNALELLKAYKWKKQNTMNRSFNLLFSVGVY